MEEFERLLKLADNLTKILDKMADEEKKYGADLCHEIETLSYESFKLSEDIKRLTQGDSYAS